MGYKGSVILTIIVFLLFVLMCIGYLIYLFSSQKTPNNLQPAPSPTTENSSPTTPVTVTLPAQHSLLQSGSFDKFEKYAAGGLSSSDDSIKKALVNRVGDSYSPLIDTPKYQIIYRSLTDLFDVTIKTSAIEDGKQEAIVWLRNQGLSDDGICRLPIFFHLNDVAIDYALKHNMTFNPLPDFCQ